MTMIRIRTLPFALAAALSIGGAGVADAQPRSLADAGTAAQETSLPALLAEVERANATLVAAKRAADAAAARVSPAGALPDPTLAVGVMNVPVSDPGFGRDPMTMATIQLASRFPWPGKLPLREEGARLRAEASRWEAERIRQKVRSEVKDLYYRVYFLDRALEVTGRNERLVADFAELTASRYGVGTGAQPDVLKAQVERTRLDDQLVALREQRAGTVARLNALLGRPADAPFPETELPEEVRIAALDGGAAGTRFASAALVDLLPSSDASDAYYASDASGDDGHTAIPQTADLERLALEHSPMIQAHVRRVAAQERAVSLAEKATLPDLNVSAAYSQRSGFSDFFNVMVSVPLPIFSGRKQDQTVVAEAATLAEHHAMHDAMVDELNAEIAPRTAELRRARSQLELLAQGILPQARTGLSSSTASYRVGRVDFLTLLDAQVTLYQHELSYHRLLADFASNLAALERAVGTEVLR